MVSVKTDKCKVDNIKATIKHNSIQNKKIDLISDNSCI